VHLNPATELAERVLLPGDPHRALAVAQSLLDGPKMFNHTRGLWGYTGVAADGELLSVQSTGMGGPSAAIVVEELIDLGARRLIRVGTCGALDPGLEMGGLLAVTAALAADGTSRALGAADRVLPDPQLVRLVSAAVAAAGGRDAVVTTTDLFYDAREETQAAWRARGAAAVEMEAAAVLQVAQRRGAAAACVLGVTDRVPGLGAPEHLRLGREEIQALGVRLGEVAWTALSGA